MAYMPSIGDAVSDLLIRAFYSIFSAISTVKNLMQVIEIQFEQP